MADIVTITDVFKPWHARKGADNLFNLNFTSGGSAFNISTYTFSAYIKEVGGNDNVITLTQGSGFTNNGATGVLNGILSVSALSNLDPTTYFMLIKVVDPSGYTFGVINSAFKLYNEIYSGDITEDVDITVNLAGTEINIDITFPGGSGGASGVTSFNTRTGAVTPVAADYDGFFLTPTEGDIAYQPLDSDLTAIAALATQSFGRSLLTQATAAAARTTLGLESRVLYINNSSSGLTGGTGETKVASVLISGGTIGANDIIEIIAICTKVGAAGAMTPRFYFNTSDAVGGIQVAVNSTVAANLWNGTIRRGVCKNSTSAQIWYNLSNASDDMTGTNSAKVSTSIAFASDTYFVVSNQNGSAADTSTLEGVLLRISRQ